MYGRVVQLYRKIMAAKLLIFELSKTRCKFRFRKLELLNKVLADRFCKKKHWQPNKKRANCLLSGFFDLQNLSNSTYFKSLAFYSQIYIIFLKTKNYSFGSYFSLPRSIVFLGRHFGLHFWKKCFKRTISVLFL